MAQLTKWNIDTTHTEVQFKVKHLVIATVTGNFRKFSGSIEADGENFDGAKAEFSIDVASIDTNQADRDGHHLQQGHRFAAFCSFYQGFPDRQHQQPARCRTRRPTRASRHRNGH